VKEKKLRTLDERAQSIVAMNDAGYNWVEVRSMVNSIQNKVKDLTSDMIERMINESQSEKAKERLREAYEVFKGEKVKEKKLRTLDERAQSIVDMNDAIYNSVEVGNMVNSIQNKVKGLTSDMIERMINESQSEKAIEVLREAYKVFKGEIVKEVKNRRTLKERVQSIVDMNDAIYNSDEVSKIVRSIQTKIKGLTSEMIERMINESQSTKAKERLIKAYEIYKSSKE
jgi:hypothetical protein